MPLSAGEQHRAARTNPILAVRVLSITQQSNDSRGETVSNCAVLQHLHQMLFADQTLNILFIYASVTSFFSILEEARAAPPLPKGANHAPSRTAMSLRDAPRPSCPQVDLSPIKPPFLSSFPAPMHPHLCRCAFQNAEPPPMKYSAKYGLKPIQPQYIRYILRVTALPGGISMGPKVCLP